MKIPILIVMFIMVSALFIVNNNNLHLQNASDRVLFGNAYYLWAESMFNNAQTVTADVIHADWLPVTNKTILNKTS